MKIFPTGGKLVTSSHLALSQSLTIIFTSTKQVMFGFSVCKQDTSKMLRICMVEGTSGLLLGNIWIRMQIQGFVFCLFWVFFEGF